MGLKWSTALQNYNNIVQCSWREMKLQFIHPSGQEMRAPGEKGSYGSFIRAGGKCVRERKGRNEQGHAKVKVYIICYLQLAHLFFAQVSKIDKHFRPQLPDTMSFNTTSIT
jgi:hypothetical protein